MSNIHSFEEIAPVMREILEENGRVSFVSGGRSMLPTIRDGVDTVTLIKPDGRLKKGDIVFYQRDNGQYILHRIIGISGDTYITRGDNQWFDDFNIRQEQIIGVLTGIERNGKLLKSDSLMNKVYVFFLPFIRWLFRIGKAVKRRIRLIKQ